jgi:hypothetical protein
VIDEGLPEYASEEAMYFRPVPACMKVDIRSRAVADIKQICRLLSQPLYLAAAERLARVY